MIIEVYNALCRAILSCFEGCKIFGEDTPQGFEDGDFIIRVISVSSSPVPGKLMKYQTKFSIEKHDKTRENLYNSMVELENAIDIITMDDGILLKADVTKNEVADNKLTLELSYSFYSYGKVEISLMEDLQYGE